MNADAKLREKWIDLHKTSIQHQNDHRFILYTHRQILFTSGNVYFSIYISTYIFCLLFL